MTGSKVRPEDWRLAGVSLGAWAGAAAGTNGLSAAWWVWAVLGAAAFAALLPRALWAAAAVALGMLAGYLSGSLALQEYRDDAATEAALYSDSVQLLVRLTEPPQQRVTPWGRATFAAAGRVQATRVSTQWVSSSVQVRLSGDVETLSGFQRGDQMIVQGKLRTDFWRQPPILGELRVQSARLVASGGKWSQFTSGVRSRMLALAGALPQPAGALVLGMSVGDRQLLEPELRQAMATASLTHLTAISGTHIGLALAALAVLVPGGRLWRPAAMVLFLVFLVGVVGPAPSVLRATGMALVAMIALIWRRPGQPQVALFLVVLTLTLTDPWIATKPGFTMSALATLGILILGRSWANKLERFADEMMSEKQSGRGLVRKVAQIVAVSAAASLWVLPPLVAITDTVPLWSVLANVLAAPAVAPVTLLGIAAAILCTSSPSIATLLMWAATPFAAWIAWVARWVAGLPGASLPWPGGTGGVLLAAGLVGLVTAVHAAYVKRRKTGVENPETAESPLHRAPETD